MPFFLSYWLRKLHLTKQSKKESLEVSMFNKEIELLNQLINSENSLVIVKHNLDLATKKLSETKLDVTKQRYKNLVADKEKFEMENDEANFEVVSLKYAISTLRAKDIKEYFTF